MPRRPDLKLELIMHHKFLKKQVSEQRQEQRETAPEFASVEEMLRYDAAHTIEGVIFENFRMNGRLAKSADDIDPFTNDHASIISFR